MTPPTTRGEPSRSHRAWTPGATLTLLALAACASAPEPLAEMAVAEAAVSRASSQATQEAAAPSLRVATDKLALARSASAAGEQDKARRLAEQAALDAQVAELQALRAAQESEDAARALREEINRKTVR